MVLLVVVGLVLAALLVIIILLVFSHWRRMVEQKIFVNNIKEKTGVGDTKECKEKLTRGEELQNGTKTTKETEGTDCKLSKVN